MSEKTDTSAWREIRLKQLKYALIRRLSSELAFSVDVEFDTIVEYMFNIVVASFRARIWAEEESAQRREFKYPANWKEAFKERWFPDWALKRWPVNYHRVVVDVKAIYPEFKFAMPDQKGILTMMVSEGVEPGSLLIPNP